MNDDIMTPIEAADMLKISRTQIYRMLGGDSPLPHFRVGGQVRFRRDVLMEHLERQTGKPVKAD